MRMSVSFKSDVLIEPLSSTEMHSVLLCRVPETNGPPKQTGSSLSGCLEGCVGLGSGRGTCRVIKWAREL